MADNYLEKKMEEHRSADATIFHSVRKKEGLVFVEDGLSPAGEAEVRRIAMEGKCHVAFGGADYRRGRKLAQQTGARFYPCNTAEDIASARTNAEKHFL